MSKHHRCLHQVVVENPVLPTALTCSHVHKGGGMCPCCRTRLHFAGQHRDTCLTVVCPHSTSRSSHAMLAPAPGPRGSRATSLLQGYSQE